MLGEHESKLLCARPLGKIKHEVVARGVMEQCPKAGVYIAPKKITHARGGASQLDLKACVTCSRKRDTYQSVTNQKLKDTAC